MTRLAVIADIHANLPALEAVLEDIAHHDVDQIVVLGDLVGRGPYPRQVVERIVQAGWPLIRGNHEYYLLDYNTVRAPAEWKNHTMTAWTQELLGSDNLKRMACWPDTLSLRFRDAPPLRVFHASPETPFHGFFHHHSDDYLCEKLAGIDEGTVVVAHTHLVLDRQVDCWHLLNPGSVGLPLDGIQQARYMLLDGDAHGWRATQRRVPFDYDALFAEIRRTKLIENCGIAGRIFAHEFRTARPQIVAAHRWLHSTYPGRAMDEAAFEEFCSLNFWPYQNKSYHVFVLQPYYTLGDGLEPSLDLRRAEHGDVASVEQLLVQAVAGDKKQALQQWKLNVPDQRALLASIERGEVYLVADQGEDVAALRLQWYDEDQDSKQVLDTLYLHKVIVRHDVAAQALERRVLAWAEQAAREAAKAHVRYLAVPRAQV